MSKRPLYFLHFKGHGMELGDTLACPNKLSGINGKSFSNPIHISAREFWRLMNMAMEG